MHDFLKNFLANLREYDAIRDSDNGGEDIVLTNCQERNAPAFAESNPSKSLHPDLQHALKNLGIKQLYRHQSEAIEKALGAGNVVLQAPTASGKTLAFQLPMLDSLLRNHSAHALMIYPNKALAFDQRDQLLKLTKHLEGQKIESDCYDGGTNREKRGSIRKNPPPILITNPDMLNLSFLGWAEQWERFYRNLKWVIVDEMHEYRGYFGSNVAMILRRFSCHLASIGIRPQFFLCSATCANADEHAKNLTGLDFKEINATDAMHPRRHFAFVQPEIDNFHYWKILQIKAVKAGLACMDWAKAVLVFCPTIKFAKECHKMAKDQLGDAKAVREFYGGLNSDERHRIQNGLKSGSIRLVFTTNALELGIDIGSLDGIILAGFPDNMMSAWQRIGRAGRSWQADAFVLYFARNNPLDRFYAANLNTFLKKPFDDLIVNPSNEDLIERHLPCLLCETPNLLKVKNAESILGRAMFGAVKKQFRSGWRPIRKRSWRPHSHLDIRGAGNCSYTLKSGKQILGTLSAQQQFREAFLEAIYLHGGQYYRVEKVVETTQGGEIILAKLRKDESHLRTEAILFSNLREQNAFAGERWEVDEIKICTWYGEVLIIDNLHQVKEMDESGNVIRNWRPEKNTAQFKSAHAFWISIEGVSKSDSAGIASLSHLLRVGTQFSIPADAHDIFAHSIANEEREAYIVESYRGGIGVARKLLERWRKALETGVGVAKECKCKNGCPSCIVPPRRHDDLDKRDGIRLAKMLIEKTNRKPDDFFENASWKPFSRSL